jgi:hypothetical protein
MSTYSEWTRQVGDQWVAALKRAEDAIGVTSESLKSAAGDVSLPPIQVPEEVTKFNEAVAERLPKPEEVVEANFELTTRLLTAQRELTLKLLGAGRSATDGAAK